MKMKILADFQICISVPLILCTHWNGKFSTIMKIAKDILLKNKDAYIKNNQKLIIQILEEYQFYLSKKKKKKKKQFRNIFGSELFWMQKLECELFYYKIILC